MSSIILQNIILQSEALIWDKDTPSRHLSVCDRRALLKYHSVPNLTPRISRAIKVWLNIPPKEYTYLPAPFVVFCEDNLNNLNTSDTPDTPGASDKKVCLTLDAKVRLRLCLGRTIHTLEELIGWYLGVSSR